MAEQDGSYLQVFMTHGVVMDRFREFIDQQGWKLALIPRSINDVSDFNYVATHIIVPKNENWFVPSGGATAGSSHESSHATPSTTDDAEQEAQPPGTA